jgi:hypothetical protein
MPEMMERVVPLPSMIMEAEAFRGQEQSLLVQLSDLRQCHLLKAHHVLRWPNFLQAIPVLVGLRREKGDSTSRRPLVLWCQKKEKDNSFAAPMRVLLDGTMASLLLSPLVSFHFPPQNTLGLSAVHHPDLQGAILVYLAWESGCPYSLSPASPALCSPQQGTKASQFRVLAALEATTAFCAWPCAQGMILSYAWLVRTPPKAWEAQLAQDQLT